MPLLVSEQRCRSDPSPVCRSLLPPSTPLPWDNWAHIHHWLDEAMLLMPAASARLRDVAGRLLPGFAAPSPMRMPPPAPLPKCSQGPIPIPVSAHPGPCPRTLLVSPEAHYSQYVPCLDTHAVCPQASPQRTAETHACIVALLSRSWLAYSYLNGLVPLRFISFLSSGLHCNGYTALHHNQQ